MKKYLLYLIAISATVAQLGCCALASSYTNNATGIAIKKYKSGNYTGCLQDCQLIVKRDPSNSVAYYYMAMSFAQAGKKDEAVKSYSKVLSLNPNSRLYEYASTGKRCLETPDKCQPDSEEKSTEIDKLINSQTNIMTSKVKQEFAQQNLNSVKSDINADREVDTYKLKKFDDYTNNRSQVDDGSSVAQKKPTNDEIVAALRVLKSAGLNPYGEASQVNAYAPVANASPVAQNPELAQLNMLMGNTNQPGDSNSMANMIPFMLAQNKNGSNNYSPQMMQAVMMNSMLPNLNFDVDKDK